MWSWIALSLAAWFALALMVGVAIGRAAHLADQIRMPRPGAPAIRPKAARVTA
jgi:hypothetical protein